MSYSVNVYNTNVRKLEYLMVSGLSFCFCILCCCCVIIKHGGLLTFYDVINIDFCFKKHY